MVFKNIYVLCPVNIVTGGPDALHQMVFYLNHVLGYNAYIVYFNAKYPRSSDCFFIPAPYKIYVNEFKVESDVIDDEYNAIVIPETFSNKCKMYKKSHVFLWWLSVYHAENKKTLFFKYIYFLTLPLRILRHLNYYKKNFVNALYSVYANEKYSFVKESANVVHLCASYYAFDHVVKKTNNNVFYCIEPISKLFLNMYADEKEIFSENRKNIILYNPKRNYTDIIRNISKVAPELKFEPLLGLTQQQLIEKYKKSKIYIDFGVFPGAERIPKEAVLFGCAVITGKRGAAGFHGDVPIPEKYKFETPIKQINEIVETIRYVLNNYENVYSDFDEYRNTVLNLEENFIISLKKLFGNCFNND